jgi:cell division FtsZ-interacting protein ZapD
MSTHDTYDTDYAESVQASRYITAISLFKFLDQQAKMLQAQIDFLTTASDRLQACKARLEVVSSEKINARKRVQELEESLPLGMVSRLGRIETDELAQQAAQAVNAGAA